MPVPGGRILADDDLGLPRPVEPLRALGQREHAFWILQQLVPDSSVATLSVALRVSRPLRWWPLHAAVNHLVSRHPALRTRFPVSGGVPLRHVSAGSDVEVTVEVGAATDADLTERLSEAAKAPFDLASDLPLRVFLFQVDDGGGALLLVLHHIVVDAVSVALLADELARTYDGFAAGEGVPDALRGEVPAADGVSRPEDTAFWVERLRGFEDAEAVLPSARTTARASPARPTLAGATTMSPMTEDAVSAVAALRRATGGTENLVLLSAWYLTLFRHGAGTDLVVGVPVDGRDAGGGAGVGFQVSTLPLRLVLDPRASFAALTRQVRDVFLTGVQHASVSAEEVIAELGHHSADWRVPLFRYLYNYRPKDESDVRIAGERPEAVELYRDESQLDIQLTVVGGQQPPVLITTYSTDVHDGADVETLLARMQALLRAAADDPDRPVTELDMATPEERAVLTAANRTRCSDLPGRTVLEQFTARADARPGEDAVVEGDDTVSYGELAATARRVTAALRSHGVRDGDVVALALPRGAALAAAVLGVWDAGACYLPLDAGQPEQRITAQVEDADARLVVVETGAAGASGSGTRVVPWDELAAGDDDQPDVESARGMDAAAYVIYTSGSTGQPRGVVVTHGNLVNVVGDFTERVDLTPDDPVLWSTTTAFDISALELCLPLCAGGTVVVAGRELQTRPRELLELVVKQDVSVVQATPTFWRFAVGEVTGDELRDRVVLCGGEPMSASLARDLKATGCRLLNVYGPTETTIWSTAAEVDADVTEPVPIGVPIANTRVFVADEHGAELAPGLLGELCIAGTGVSAGYLGCREPTEERFVPSLEWGRYYRTGDLARWRADGVLELFGRDDRQVKLRGHRIELPEVEVALREHVEVADAAVVVVGDPQTDAELRAFVEPVPGAEPAGLPDRLWPHLRARLPSYVLPSRVTVLPELPVSGNGKRDYAALRSAEVTSPAPEPRQEDVPDPHPELTGKLLALWRETLGRPALGERDHFFLNGGHSLLAVQLASRVEDVVGGGVLVRTVFDHPTARQLSAHLAGER